MIKKLMLLIFIFVLLVGTVSSLEIDNVKTFNKNDRSLTVHNAFNLPLIGSDIAKITPLTPHVVSVFRGENRTVAKFYVNNYVNNYVNVWKDMEFYNLKKNGEQEQRKFYFKYKLIVGTEEKPIIKQVCNNLSYPNGDCWNVIKGYENVSIIEWRDLDVSKPLPKGNYTIKIITDVFPEEHMEFIPTWFGVRMPEYAEWTESLNTGLIAYYALNESSGTVAEDSFQGKNGTCNVCEGDEWTTDGIIGNAIALDRNSDDNESIAIPDDSQLDAIKSWSCWFNRTDTDTADGDRTIIQKGGASNDLDPALSYNFNGGNYKWFDSSRSVKMTIPLTINNFTHFVYAQSGTNATIYVNGNQNTTATVSSATEFDNVNGLFLGGGTASRTVVGVVDECSFWNVTLTGDQVTQLYNGGQAISFTNVFDFPPIITLNSPINAFNTTNQTIEFNGLAVSTLGITNVTLFIDGILNETNSSGINDTDYLFTKTISDGNHNWTYDSCNDDGCTTATTRTFTIDSTNPFVNITHPLSTVSYQEVNTNLTVNWTVSDLSLDVCILEFEGINRTVTCLDNSTEINITNNVNRTVIFYANDTLGRANSTFKSWNYTIFEHSLNYSLSTIGGTTEEFELNVTKDSSLQISKVDLVYNLSASTATFTIGDNLIIFKELNIPNPDSDINFSFYFSFTLSDSQIINTSSNNQTVLNFAIGNCSVFTTLVYNFTLLDEINQTQLSNVTIDYAFNLFDISRTTPITNFSLSSKVNPTAICINQNLTQSSFSLDGILKYVSNDSSNYLTRYYNILNFTLSNSSIPKNINIYDVVDTVATPFQLTFRDNFLILTPSILVNVNKQYVDSNDFKTVEIPITDTNGQTILNLVRNTAVYNLILIDLGGNIVASFSKINAFCQDFTIGECTLNLDASSTITKTFNLSESTGISYTLEYVNSTSTAIFTFNSINSTAVTARIVGTTQNQFGNQTVCDNSLTSTLGALTCDASSILATDNYLFIDVFSDGNYVTTQIININPANPLIGGLFGTNGYFIAFFMLLLIIILFSDDKQVLLIMLGMGWATILIFGLIKGAIIGSISGGIWLLVSIITMIWKLKQEEVPG